MRHGSHEFQFWVLNCVCIGLHRHPQIHQAGNQDTPQAELAAMKKVDGGINLAYKLMSTALRDHCRILLVASKACWDWYTDQVKHVKSPRDGIKYSVAMSEGKWMKELHLWRSFQHTLHDKESLQFMNIQSQNDVDGSLPHKALMLVWHIVSHRAWSLSRHDVPPEQFAHAASSCPRVAARAMTQMKDAWGKLMLLEQSRSQAWLLSDCFAWCWPVCASWLT